MRARVLLAVVGLVGLLGCTGDDGEGRSADGSSTPTESLPETSTPTVIPSPRTSTPAPPSADVTVTPAPHPVSLPSLFDADYDGRDLELGDVLDQNDAYTRYAVTYISDGLTISGIMNVPAGDGPFPVLILAHGYIDPAVYTSGRGLAREQDYLARHGYVALHTDYRNHAGSDDDPDNELKLRLGYAVDVINAVHAVRVSDLPELDRDRVGLLGRSMGGGVVYNTLVAAPGLVDAAVAYAPVSSNAVDNFYRWTRGSPIGDQIVDTYGEPDKSPRFWRDVSPRPFFERVTEPILMFHGTADATCPIEWSRETVDALHDAGVDAELVVYDGEQHAFGPHWQESIERTTQFFNAHLD